jgi:hypothetical protein
VSSRQRPILLVVDKLIAPVEKAQGGLQRIEQSLANDELCDLHVQGMFVLALAGFESMLQDMLAYYFRQIPAALPKSEKPIPKDAMLSNRLLDHLIQETVRDWGYAKLSNLVNRVHGALSLAAADSESVACLNEIKETRNLLLHNSLVVNHIYLEKAGPKCRANRLDQKLALDRSYLAYTLDVLHAATQDLREKAAGKYATYTHHSAVRKLWDHLFTSPVMEFDDYWDTRGSAITFKRAGQREDHLANSEQMLLGVWLQHFNPYYVPKKVVAINMRSLDDTRREDLIYLLTTVADLSLE